MVLVLCRSITPKTNTCQGRFRYISYAKGHQCIFLMGPVSTRIFRFLQTTGNLNKNRIINSEQLLWNNPIWTKKVVNHDLNWNTIIIGIYKQPEFCKLWLEGSATIIKSKYRLGFNRDAEGASAIIFFKLSKDDKNANALLTFCRNEYFFILAYIDISDLLLTLKEQPFDDNVTNFLIIFSIKIQSFSTCLHFWNFSGKRRSK